MPDQNPDQLVDPEILDKVKHWRGFVEAKLGFRNHWYPILQSKDVEEGGTATAKLCGEDLIFTRFDGEVCCLRDKCIHRGVKFSKKPECHKKGTITCWYHGFTYDFRNGKLTDVIASEGSRVVDGVRGTRSYEVREAKGLIFVFMGDRDQEIPPLSSDVPPNFLDDDMVVFSRTQFVNANYRIGIENGFDTTHIYIHRTSNIFSVNNAVVPLGFVPTQKVSFERVIGENGSPTGVMEYYGPDMIASWQGKIGGEVVMENPSDLEGKNLIPHEISAWLPGCLVVRPWPMPYTSQYEFYVPVTADKQLYVQAIGSKCESEERATEWEYEFNNTWEEMAFRDFNSVDIRAREAIQERYVNDHMWVDEVLYEADKNLLEYRRVASEFNRGIQRPHHLRT